MYIHEYNQIRLEIVLWFVLFYSCARNRTQSHDTCEKCYITKLYLQPEQGLRHVTQVLRYSPSWNREIYF